MTDTYTKYSTEYLLYKVAPDVLSWGDVDERTITEDQNGPYKSTYDAGVIYFVSEKMDFHREDGPAKMMDDRVIFYRHGQIHREDGPAILYKNGSWEYALNDRFHRNDGPAAYITAIPGAYYKWYYKGECWTNEMNQFCKDNCINIENISEDEQFLIRLKMAEFDV